MFEHIGHLTTTNFPSKDPVAGNIQFEFKDRIMMEGINKPKNMVKSCNKRDLNTTKSQSSNAQEKHIVEKFKDIDKKLDHVLKLLDEHELNQKDGRGQSFNVKKDCTGQIRMKDETGLIKLKDDTGLITKNDKDQKGLILERRHHNNAEGPLRANTSDNKERVSEYLPGSVEETGSSFCVN